MQQHQIQGDKLQFNLAIDQQPTWISAQEILTSEVYYHWGDNLAKRSDVTHEVIGWSVQKRPLYKMEIQSEGNEWLVVLGRQHPPEITGALAVFPFTETLLADTPLARKFRQRFNILVIPNINPDGVYLGNWRHNANGADLNRDWGKFNQPEVASIHQYLTQLVAKGQKLSMGVDFHSTKKDIFYTMPLDLQRPNPRLVSDWIADLDNLYSDVKVLQKPGHNPDSGVFKQYFTDSYNTHAVTYEMGDNTDRAFIKDFAQNAAISLMKNLLATPALTANHSSGERADILITKGTAYLQPNNAGMLMDIAVCGEVICGVYPTGEHQVKAKKVIDASGKVVSPGFIDPHTHSLSELLSKDRNHNLNYLTQGVTTVVNGNDGGGPVDIADTKAKLIANGIGTNTALLVGHGSIRKQVMGLAKRHANQQELVLMEQHLEQAMQDGAIGLSSGLYYLPGSFADTSEVVALAKIASKHGGIYDTHLRDESTFNIGFINALDEAIEIADAAKIHLHLAHIKALGVDVWGQSKAAIAKIEQAQARGLSITADQYPWLASGTKLHNAVFPKWVMADSKQAFYQRLNQANLLEKIKTQVNDNIRRRGGSDALLITEFKDQTIVGLTLAQVAKQRGLEPVDLAIELVQQGDVRVASFNMAAQDVERFMTQPWVVTSSDGTNGHPRKYASFPQKYQQYVVEKPLLNISEFIHQSSTQSAKILGLKDRGSLKIGLKADIIVFDPNTFAPKADYANWNRYSTGVEQVLVNGQLVIENQRYLERLAGQVVN